ncbi:MAG: imidazole glycerol phosphate synthase subunit HisH [Xanthomonadales bacterium]|jgi:glutamine amidotransferase|nr:imidazole glycerol phosphate synthase subunit HisH [Xanthomonadales bacterium]MDH3925011.1 imidazole glycerol phosphate synthase subunit HisH [Xanthomonadales bacterium]MDH3940771.1 imidazole glycerol phosphate synthase subunit HisH [Xanthomonadales bacterium]MDH4000006.1 imidazole glycerol phosphate synthase subunit HisH [Xanthomonadales bacterium]
MSVAVVNSGGANIASVLHALRRLGAEPVFTASANAIRAADRVILPGVGAAGRAMEVLAGHGLVDTLRSLQQPVLGICLGMQLLFDSSEEDDAGLLGIIPGRLERLRETESLRVPHMGWNSLMQKKADRLTANLNGQWFYFVHSFAAPVSEWSLSTSFHGSEFSAIVRKDNFYGAQFHPERSAGAGAELLRGFLETPTP